MYNREKNAEKVLRFLSDYLITCREKRARVILSYMHATEIFLQVQF